VTDTTDTTDTVRLTADVVLLAERGDTWHRIIGFSFGQH
jgi:hypothetical protein